jgi:anthranilate phosphoribosyltransferase
MLLAALENRPGPARDVVALNAGASIYVSGLVDTLEDAVKRAHEVIASGAARRKVDELSQFTAQYKTN